MPIKNVIDSLNIAFASTKLEGKICDKCGKKECFDEPFIMDTNKYFILYIPRDDDDNKRLNTFKNSLQINLENYMIYKAEDKKLQSKYDLIAAIHHSGTTSGGHYTAFTKYYNIWYEISDTSIYKTTTREVEDCKAMILFYEKAK